MSSAGSKLLMTEVFPILTETLPPLYSYSLDLSDGDKSTVGGKLAYRLKRTFEGHWAWADSRIVTDAPQDESHIMEVIKPLWAEQPKIFHGLRGIKLDSNWKPSAKALSDFVARGLLSDYEGEIRSLLNAQKRDLGNVYVERVIDIRGWQVQHKPAVSVSISSRLLHKQDVADYIAQYGVDDLEGLEVADKTSTLKGTVQEIVGPLSGERERLLAVTQREEMQSIIEKAPDDEWVVKVRAGFGSSYDYVVSALRFIVRSEHFHRFKVNAKTALNAMRIDPAKRADLITRVSGIAQRQYVGKAYNSTSAPHLFQTTRYASQVLVGNNKAVPYNESILTPLQKHGLYKLSDRFSAGNPIRVGFINALNGDPTADFWNQIEVQLRSLGFGVQKVGTISVDGGSRAAFERAINELGNMVDVLLAFFPDQYDDDDEDESAYARFKSLTVGRGIPSQVIEQSTMKNTYSVGNIVMGILGKTGNIPYVLADSLDFADVIVGIDVAREKKKRLQGSVSATAVARLYLNNGEFLQYAIHDAPLEGETVPANVLQALFPLNTFAGKRVIVHRDGYFRGDEKRALKAWASEIGATFHLVQVIKSGSPRVYAYEKQLFVQPQKGSAFLISDSEALLVSSLPPFKNATPQPLRITAEQPFTIEQALKSVLAMTDLHYGSLRAPRLPVTIHYSDQIAYLAIRGIKPQNLVGNIPYWL